MFTQHLLHLTPILLGFGLAKANPTPVEYHYRSGDKVLQRPTKFRPVTFNGIAVGVTELSQTAEDGTIHSLSDGHHFFHRGWYISDSDDGPAWKYLPQFRNQTTSLEKRSGDVDPGDLGTFQVVTDRMSAPYLGGATIDFVDIIESPPFTIDEVSWTTANTNIFGMDLYFDDAFVTSTDALFGELVDIFWNALEIFA
jgi:hypothetical protein